MDPERVDGTTAVDDGDLRFPIGELTVRPWPDSVIDQVGHDPRSSYVERFWLGVLGPSTLRLCVELSPGLSPILGSAWTDATTRHPPRPAASPSALRQALPAPWPPGLSGPA